MILGKSTSWQLIFMLSILHSITIIAGICINERKIYTRWCINYNPNYSTSANDIKPEGGTSNI